jgi:murein DD-endopeptidase MepM/ murein hydrolase activator NlpD
VSSRSVLAVALVLVAAAVGPASGPLGRPRSEAAPAPRSRPAPSVPWAAPGGVSYTAPAVPLRVVRPFLAPPTRYGPGHRGVDLGIGANREVRSAGAGTVRFAGSVGGRGVVVVLHADGISTEYEPLTSSVRTGATVRAGQPIGRVSGRHRGCARPCLHWGARRGDVYVDPLSLLQPLGPVVLLPWPRRG